MEKEKAFYTAGIFAKKAGVTLKTIYHYQVEELLMPSAYSQAGYRLYSDEDFGRLQKILTLKFIGFSLAEIKEIIKSEAYQSNIGKSLNIQMDIIDEKIKHLSLVKKAIKEAENMIDTSSKLDWSKFTNIIQIINTEKVWMTQYKNASNLCARILLHDRFSSNKMGWHRWMFDCIQLMEGMSVLELGCGNASLWKRNISEISQNCRIILTDVSDGMLEDAKLNLGTFAHRFEFQQVNAQSIPYRDNSFDVVIADHILYHISDRKKAFSEIKRVLKPGGYIYASTIGEKHLFELKSLLKEFDSNLVISKNDLSQDFGLQNGETQLVNWFEEIELIRYEDNLIVTEVEPLIDYVHSTTGNINDIIVNEKHNEFKAFLEKKLMAAGSIFITKETGLFKAKKG